MNRLRSRLGYISYSFSSFRYPTPVRWPTPLPGRLNVPHLRFLAWNVNPTARPVHPTKALLLGPLPEDVTHDAIHKALCEFGSITSLQSNSPITQRLYTGKYCHVQYLLTESAMKAMDSHELNPITLKNYTLQMRYTQTVHSLRPEQPPGPPKTLFVGNIPTHTTPAQIKKIFSNFGPVRQVRWTRDPLRFKGFCHVEFDSLESLDAALEHHDHEPIWLGSAKLKLDRASFQPVTTGRPHYKLFFRNFVGSEDSLRRLVGEEYWKGKVSRVVWYDREKGYIQFYKISQATEALASLRARPEALFQNHKDLYFEFKRNWSEQEELKRHVVTENPALKKGTKTGRKIVVPSKTETWRPPAKGDSIPWDVLIKESTLLS